MGGSRIGREHRWLRAAFGGALVAAAAPALALGACSADESPGPTGGTGGGAPLDAGSDRDGAGGDARDGGHHEGGGERDADAAEVSCAEALTPLDATVPDGGPDANQVCRVHLPCGVPEGTDVMGCTLVQAGPDGGPMSFGCNVLDDGGCHAGHADPTGDLTVDCPCDLFMAGGRRPSGGARRPRPARARDVLGAYLAAMAREEAASVGAFVRLEDELRALGAPAELVAAAARAARDEVRHARAFTGLARARGAEPAAPPRARRPRAPALEAVARENAVEGCVRETFAALLAHAQAARAGDARVREVLAGVARDETRHAALAWAVARWAEARLDAAARARVARARARALRRVAREVAAAPPARLAWDAGMPSAGEASRLLEAFVEKAFGGAGSRSRGGGGVG